MVQLAGIIEKVKRLIEAIAEERRLFDQPQAMAPDADTDKALLIQFTKAGKQHLADHAVNDGENHRQRTRQQDPQPLSRPLSVCR